MKGARPVTTFLNVDLELTSTEDLAPLVDALRTRMFALHVGRAGRRYRATLELRRQPRTPDAAIRHVTEAIRRLPRKERAHWNRAATRDFNIGVQAGRDPQATELAIEPATVAAVAKLGGRIIVTVYGSALADK